MKTRLFWIYAPFGLSLILAGYCVGKTIVIDAGASRTVTSVAVIEASSAVTVPAEADATFKKKLDESLFTRDGFQKGEELTLTYRFVQFDEGSRFKRWAFFGLAGEGRLTIEVVYADMSGKELGKIMSEVKIGSLHNSTRLGVGFYGGSSDDAIEKAAKEIAGYSVTHFITGPVAGRQGGAAESHPGQ
jgi:hypothetical protein